MTANSNNRGGQVPSPPPPPKGPNAPLSPDEIARGIAALTRGRAQQIPGAGAIPGYAAHLPASGPAGAPAPLIPQPSFDYFRSLCVEKRGGNVVPENKERNRAMMMVTTLINLLREDQVRSFYKFDENNIVAGLQALFSKSLGREVSPPDIAELVALDPNDWKTIKIVFSRILELDRETDHNVIRDKLDQFAADYKQLESLSAGEELAVQMATYTLRRVLQGENMKAVVTDKGFEAPKFDVTVFSPAQIQRMMEVVRAGAAAAAAPAPATATQVMAAALTIDYATFYVEHEGILTIPYKELFRVFQINPDEFAQHYQTQIFKGDDLQTVHQRINAACDVPNLSYILASPSGSNVAAVIGDIAKATQLERDPARLEKLLAETKDRIGELYPMLLDSADPKRIQIEAEEAERSKRDIDYKAFFTEFTKEAERLLQWYPLYHLFGALASPDDQFIDLSKKYFGGKKREAVLRELDLALGHGIAEKLVAATQLPADQEPWNTAFIQVIAEHFKLTKKPDELTRKIKEIYESFKGIFPNLLHEKDSYWAS